MNGTEATRCLLCRTHSTNTDLFAQYILKNNRSKYRDDLCKKHELLIKLAH
ncbi:MAG: hypothetical protein ACXAE3_09295 [Candidatus Kariarchaeaceae archaeon]